jgi:pimeloyl-ACP methyl ester carboxylesterase
MDKWDPLLVNTLAASRTVVLVDYAGVGSSTGEVATTIRKSAQDITQFLEAIGETEIDLLGFSIGGYVAQLIALNAGSFRVRKLILAGTGSSYGPDVPASPNEDVGEVATVPEPNINTFKTLFFPQNSAGDAAAVSWWARLQERSTATCGEELSQWLSSGHKDKGKGMMAQVAQLQNFAQAETTKGLEGAYERLHELKMPILVAQGYVRH